MLLPHTDGLLLCSNTAVDTPTAQLIRIMRPEQEIGDEKEGASHFTSPQYSKWLLAKPLEIEEV